MKKEVQNLIESAGVYYSSLQKYEKTPWWITGKILVDGYKISIAQEYFPTIEEATQALKNRLSEAVTRWDT